MYIFLFVLVHVLEYEQFIKKECVSYVMYNFISDNFGFVPYIDRTI